MFYSMFVLTSNGIKQFGKEMPIVLNMARCKLSGKMSSSSD